VADYATDPEVVDDASMELGLLLNRIHGDHGQYVAVHGWKKAAADALAKLGAPGVAIPPVPDDVWEALQRLIENAASLGPSSQEDAMVVARWRGQFVAAREAAARAVTACPAPQPRSHIEGVNLPPVNPRPAPPPVPGASTSCPLCHAVGGGHFSGCSQYRPSMTMGCEACESLGCTGACGVIGPPAPPVVARVFIEVGQSPRFLLQPTAPVAVKQGLLREGWNDLVPAGVPGLDQNQGEKQ
jgi:hypothetical protein